MQVDDAVIPIVKPARIVGEPYRRFIFVVGDERAFRQEQMGISSAYAEVDAIDGNVGLQFVPQITQNQVASMKQSGYFQSVLKSGQLGIVGFGRPAYLVSIKIDSFFPDLVQ